MSKQILTREQKGQEIANIEGSIIFTAQNTYRVKSQTSKTVYHVTNTELGWCTCPDHEFRGVRCKHIFAVEIRFALHREVEVRKIEPITNVSQCIYCKCEKIVKMELDITGMEIFRNSIVKDVENTLPLT
jgi:putative transposase